MRYLKAWTDEEEVIFNDLVKKVVMEHMWAAAKEDGRLAHRGSSGIKAHVKAMVSHVMVVGQLIDGDARFTDPPSYSNLIRPAQQVF